jgi:hypothetical protein
MNTFANWNSPETQKTVRAQLTEKFLDDLINVRIEDVYEKLFKEYGTHIITGYSAGGWVEYLFTSHQRTESVNTSDKNNFELAMKAVVSYGVTVEADGLYSKMEAVETAAKSLDFTSESETRGYGGRGPATLTGDPKDVQTAVSAWLATLDLKSPATWEIMLNDKLQLVGIWDLLPDEPKYRERKQELIQAFANLVISMQIQFYNEFLYKAIRRNERLVDVYEDFSAKGPVPDNTVKLIENVNDFMNIGGRDYPLSGDYVLTTDLNLDGYERSRFAMLNQEFTGTFEGNGHTIYNFNLNYDAVLKGAANNANIGLFSKNSGVIKNLVIDNARLTFTTDERNGPLEYNVGMIAGANEGTIDNVRVIYSTVEITVNTNPSGVTKNSSVNCGGIAGINTGNITRCMFENVIKDKPADSSKDPDDPKNQPVRQGIIINAIMKNAKSDSRNIVAAGGIAGSNGSRGSISDCHTNALVDVYIESTDDTVKANAHHPYLSASVGGIAGTATSASKITRCLADEAGEEKATLTAKCRSDAGTVIENINVKPVKYIGRIIGDNQGKTMTDCFCIDYPDYPPVGNGNQEGLTLVPNYKVDDAVNIMLANKWEYNTMWPSPRLPDCTSAQRGFWLYYDNHELEYFAGSEFPEELSDIINVYFDGRLHITDRVSVSYDFSKAGKEKGFIEFKYSDAANSFYVGLLKVDVAETPVEEAVKNIVSYYSGGGVFSVENGGTNPGIPADGKIKNFKPANEYKDGQFPDVDENEWYGSNNFKVIATAFEYGLMKGNADGTFSPNGNVTIAAAVTIAARVHSIYETGSEDFAEPMPGAEWYQAYVDYAIANEIIKLNDFGDYAREATRGEMAYIFSQSLPSTEFAVQNTIVSLPDVNNGTPYSEYIFTLYEAGVLTGSDSLGTFKPSDKITRAEAATIISRVILPATRVSGKIY